MVARLLKLGWRSHLKELNNLVEIAFFMDNFLSTYLITNYNFYLAANYLKIMNVTRISDIVIFMQNRWKKKLLLRYMKEREKLKRNQEMTMYSLN
jgi:hypothetical protein